MRVYYDNSKEDEAKSFPERYEMKFSKILSWKIEVFWKKLLTFFWALY